MYEWIDLYLMFFVVMMTSVCSDDSANSLNKMWTGDTPVSMLCKNCVHLFAVAQCSVFVMLWGVSGCAALVFIWDESFPGISRDLAYFCLCQSNRLCCLQSPLLQEETRDWPKKYKRHAGIRHDAKIKINIYKYIDVLENVEHCHKISEKHLQSLLD